MSALSPHDPISDPSHLFGRDAELASLKRYIERGGAQPLVTGYRGIGKTSLVNCYLRSTNARVLKVRCGHLTTFGALSKELLEQIDEAAVHATRRSSKEGSFELKGGIPILSGAGAKKQSEEETRGPLEFAHFTYNDLLRELTRRGTDDRPTLIVIEEIDTIRDGDCVTSLVELIKACSDDWVNSQITVLSVGIQAAVSKFILKHKSLNRCAREVYLEPIAPSNLKKIITTAEEELRVRFPDVIANDIAEYAGGFPYFVHMMADYCIQGLEHEGWRSREVSLAVYERAKSGARREAYQAMLAEVAGVWDDPNSIEMSILHFLSTQKGNYVSTERIISSVARSAQASRVRVREVLWSIIKHREILYFHKGEKAVSFVGPAIKPFILSQFRPSLKAIPSAQQGRLALE